MSRSIPHATEPLLDGAGRLSRAWFTYLSSLAPSEASAALQAQIDRLWEEFRQLPDAGLPKSTQVIGSETIDVEGTLAAGRVVLALKPLPVEVGGTLQKITRDAYGRVSELAPATIADLEDVSDDAPALGDLLQWDGTQWKPNSVELGVLNLDGGNASSVYGGTTAIDGGNA